MQTIGVWILGAKTSGELNLGRQGENLVSCLVLDAKQYIAAYGDGTIQVRHLRSGDTSPYPVAELKRDGTQFIWTITSGDTAVVGDGLLEVRWYVGDALKISQTRKTRVEKAMQEDSAIAPDVWDGYLDRIHRSGAAVEEAAQNAIQQYEETVEQATADTVALVEKTGSNQVSNVKAQEKRSLQAVKGLTEESTTALESLTQEGVSAVQQQEAASLENLQNKQNEGVQAINETSETGVKAVSDTASAGLKAIRDTSSAGVQSVTDTKTAGVEAVSQTTAAGVNAVKQQEQSSVGEVTRLGEGYLEQARQAALSNGYAAFDVDEDGIAWLTRTNNVVEKLDFSISDEGELEVIILGE